jgi:hypothetical protein
VKQRPGETDPFVLLGLDPSCGADDVLAARRRLSKRLHPDVGGDGAGMRVVNAAADEALRRIGSDRTAARSAPAPTSRHSARPERGPTHRSVHDHPSFTIEALPAEAFEGLLIVAAELGDVLDDHPPYLLEVALRAPVPGWCRLDLVPDAGASTVSLTIGAEPGGRPPALESVRDAWIDGLNRLDWSNLDAGSRPPRP